MPIQAGLITSTHHEADPLLKRVETMLNDKGYQETATCSFVGSKVQSLLHPDEEVLLLSSPIPTNMSAMHLSLWTGLLSIVVYNQNRQQNCVCTLETGLRFMPDT